MAKNQHAEWLKEKRKKLILENVSNDPLLEATITKSKADDPSYFKTINIDARMHTSIVLADFSDVHIGDPNCDLEKFIRCLKKLKQLNNCYIIFNGDILNFATRNSKSNPLEDIANTAEQPKIMIKIGSDPEILDMIVAYISGNHEGGDRTQDNLQNPSHLITTALGIYELTADHMCLLQFKITPPASLGLKEPVTLKCFSRHGDGRGSSPLDITLSGTRVYANADIILTGHYHTNQAGEMAMEYFNSKIKRTWWKKVYIKSSNSFINYANYVASSAASFSNTEPSILHVSIAPNSSLKEIPISMRKDFPSYEFSFSEIQIESPTFDELIKYYNKNFECTYSSMKILNDQALTIKKVLKESNEINKHKGIGSKNFNLGE